METLTYPEACALVERLRVEHAAALDVEHERQTAHDKRRTDATWSALQTARRYTSSVLAALVQAYDDRAALAPDAPSQALVTVGPRKRLRSTDVGSLAPDALDGVKHVQTRKRSNSGRTDVRVGRRGMAPVQGDTAWDVDALADALDVEHAAALALLVDMLASSALADVGRLTLGARSLDVERAASSILAALDVDALVGTDAMAWHNVDSLDAVDVEHVEHAADVEHVDARTRALMASGDALETLVALSRHRCGITGGVHPALDVFAMPACPTSSADVAPWPAGGPKTARPGVPAWRKSERADVERVEHGAGYWRATAPADAARVTYYRSTPVERDPLDGTARLTPVEHVERVIGRTPRQHGAALCQTDVERWRRVTDADGVEHVERYMTPHPLRHDDDATCDECEHAARVNRAAERMHVGVETVERGARADGRKRASTRAERRGASARAASVAASIVEHVAPDVERVRAALAVLDVEHDSTPVRFVTDRTRVRVVRRAASARWDVRADGVRIGRPRSLAACVELVASALALDVE